jgi:inhibitor of KinA
MNFELIYRRFSERSILVEWPQEISDIILKDVLLFKNSILNSCSESIIQVNTAYNSILISYKTTIDNVNDEILTLKTHYLTRKIGGKDTNRLFKIPVCYDEDYGLDLVAISEETQLSISEIIKRHSQPVYTVFFIGFLPGFLYLGGLDKRLHFPRKKSPRLQIKKGAVAIGGQQTGIYPNASPGGWNIIGNSPIPLFLPKKKEPCFTKPGDKIKFIPVSRMDYNSIVLQIENGTYVIESEVIDG